MGVAKPRALRVCWCHVSWITAVVFRHCRNDPESDFGDWVTPPVLPSVQPLILTTMDISLS